MIEITVPEVEITIHKKDHPEESHIFGFNESDIHRIPRDQGGIMLFYNDEGELLFVGKARKLRQRVKKHFNDNASVIKEHRDEVTKIEICVVDSPVDRDIYETFLVNEFEAKYNVDNVYFR